MNNKQSCLVDTSIILDDIENLFYIFHNVSTKIYISDIVIEELDKHKNLNNQNGFFAREFFRNIHYEDSEKLDLEPCDGDFFKQVRLCKNDTRIPLIFVYRKHYKSEIRDYSFNDTRIAEIVQDYGFVLLSNDIALRTRLLARGIKTQSLFRDRVEDPGKINFWSQFKIHKDHNIAILNQDDNFKKLSNWSLIEVLEEDNTGGLTYLTGKRFYGIKQNDNFESMDLDGIVEETQPYIRPINLEQKMLYAMLLHPKNFISVATGSTGSGKTLIALQAGIYLVKKKIVDGIVYLRNTITANDKEAELGYRKGDEEQKLYYFMYPLYSVINFTITTLQNQSLAKKIEYRGEANGLDKEYATEYFLQKHKIEVMDIAHARGITLSNKFVIFDEVQNASNATIKLIGTRMGENSRICFLGDWKQIDHPYLSKFRNGAVSLLQKALSCDEIAGIQLQQVIRSNVATFFEQNF
ncbi:MULTISPECIES: PhoH family protein [unclassified Helicobacter]|uniref:PhoH family protein n=1 Tax=unclassified Helicobacter TaxID=2593540 RepID=UPI000CF1B2E8|nr:MULTISPECIES: PhoH family protein [unclassified Helicobacter]